MNTTVVVEVVPLNVCDDFHCSKVVDPDSGLGVTDHDEPLSTEIAAGLVVSV
jgi:hypothetical protein